MKDKKILMPFLIFCAGILLAFGCITLLKFQDPTKNIFMFLLTLIGMHGGIVGFIISKKMFKKAGLEVKKFYSEEYFLLALYIPLLAFKFVINSIWPATAMPEDVYLGVILTLTAVNVILSVRNALNFTKSIKEQTATQE